MFKITSILLSANISSTVRAFKLYFSEALMKDPY